MPITPISPITEQTMPSADPIATTDTIGTTDRTLEFQYSEAFNAYRSDIIPLTGDCYLTVTLPSRGRLAIRKANSISGPWPVVLMSPHTGPDFEIRIYGETYGKYIRIETTHQPIKAEITPI